MRKFSLIVNLLLITLTASAQSDNTRASLTKIWDDYATYREPTIKDRFFKHQDLQPLIQKHAASGKFTSSVAGQSVQGRSISVLKTGNPDGIKVLLWSQMHGDESTATMALFDMFNFLSGSDGYNPLREKILGKLNLQFIPMLNPDGAQAWKRRNDMEIDINRDARMLVTPEGNALMSAARAFKPEVGFNLHDQNTLYSSGRSGKSATISFLAPAYNYPKDMNAVRKRATQLILTMNDAIQTKSPGNVAKYDDAFDPRCFGDTFQGMGISTILIESGGYAGDPEKQFIRKLNFFALLHAFNAIADGSFERKDLKEYEQIPENGRALYDVLVKNINITKEGRTFKTHLGINRSQIKGTGAASMDYSGRIEELGDVELMFGYDEIDAEGMSFIPGKIKTMTQQEWSKLSAEDELGLLKQGFLFVKWSDGRSPSGPVRGRLLNLTNGSENSIQTASIGGHAQFLIGRDGQPRFAVVNGYKVDLSGGAKVVPNVLGY